MQTSNTDAKSFYLAHGFEEVETLQDYYRNIEPTSCFLLKRSLKEGHSVAGKPTESDIRPQDADQTEAAVAVAN